MGKFLSVCGGGGVHWDCDLGVLLGEYFLTSLLMLMMGFGGEVLLVSYGEYTFELQLKMENGSFPLIMSCDFQ